MPDVSLEEFKAYVDSAKIDNKPISKPVTSGGSVKYSKRKPLNWRQKLYQEKLITKFENFNTEINKIHDIKIGETYWYEYHCLESPDSSDAELWYRSHQEVKVLDQEETEPGEPECFNIKFVDDFEGVAFDDELMLSTKEFYRPDPPERKIN
jgi:hypothetical protein